MRRTAKRLLGIGMLAAAGYAVWRAFDAKRADSTVSWEPQPFPYPPVPRTPEAGAPPQTAAPDGGAPGTALADGDNDRPPETAPVGNVAWVDPVDGECPATHPVKGKLSSGIFHLPGGATYERTRPDRCYADPEAAEADGLRAAKA